MDENPPTARTNWEQLTDGRDGAAPRGVAAIEEAEAEEEAKSKAEAKAEAEAKAKAKTNAEAKA